MAFYQNSVFDFLNSLQIYQAMLIYRIFSGSFLDNLELFFFIKLSWQKKVIFLQMHHLILQRVISKCKNDKP